MPTNRLTDARCRSVKPGASPEKHFDGGGLALVVLPSGMKVWRLFVRQAGKQRPVTLGRYPQIGLAEARTRAAEARDRIARGEAGSLKVAAQQAAAPALTVEKACRRYWRGRGDVTEGYRDNAVRGLELHVFPRLGAVGVAQLTRAQVLEVLQLLDARGKHVYVRKVRIWLAGPLDQCVELEEAPANVARAINPERAFGRRQVEHHPAVTLAEVPELMHRLSLERDLQSVMACRLLALTWVRTTELRMARWAEFEGTMWRIPRQRMKIKAREHLVPLSTQALQILKVMEERSGGSDYVFPADHRSDRPMSENAVLYLLARIGYGGRMSGHGWRSVASTWANENGWNADAIERQLAHAPADETRAAYNSAQYLAVRIKMMQAWADWLMPTASPDGYSRCVGTEKSLAP